MSSEPQKLCLVGDGDPSNGARDAHIPADRIEYVENFPPVGIVRFGDPGKEYFLAPEVPGHTNPPAGINRFRDSEQKIRRQAVRFRVHAYSRDNNILGEVNNQVTIGDNTEKTYILKWTAHVANKKVTHTAFQGHCAHYTQSTRPIPHQLKPDDRIKLIVDAKGEISTGTKFVNLEGTFQGSNSQVNGGHMASLKFRCFNIMDQQYSPSGTCNGHFSSKAVLAILKSDNVKKRNKFKARILEKLRKPDFEDPTQADAKYMPRLSRDNDDMRDPGLFPANLQPDIKRFSTLTKLQYERFRKWKDDDKALDSVWSPEPQQQRIEDFQKDDQPDYLMRASLESTIGDPLFPGIEMYWIAKLSTTYDFGVSDLVPPFRVNHGAPGSLTDPHVKPGDLTRGLSLP
ncbi:hypothetical protein AN958_01872 [Leucoagaricus sp. SymC.cos]|nr:hypothetical protein AN958_01872 [Leucoagaricus sp. SymC.cos]